MSGFSVKRVNVVGAFASLWAFIFAFFPFYRIEPMEVLIQQAGKQAESYALTKNLVSSERPEQSSETPDEKI